MQKRFFIGGLMVLAGLGLLTPRPGPVLTVPVLRLGFSGETIVAWLAATLGGTALLVSGFRRMLVPARIAR